MRNIPLRLESIILFFNFYIMENIPSIFHPLSDSPSGEQEANGWGEPANRENRPSRPALRAPHTGSMI